MKVSEAIEMLQKHNPDEEILISYWAKVFFEHENLIIDNDIWNKVVKEKEYSFFMDLMEENITALINEGLEEIFIEIEMQSNE